MKKTIFSVLTLIALVSMFLVSSCDTFMKVVIVRTLVSTDLSYTSVKLKGEVVSTGGSGEVSERGFYYGTTKNLNNRNAIVVECGPGKKGEFEASITGLLPNMKYYYKAYAKNDEDLDVGELMEFTTFKIDLVTKTEQPTIVSPENITFNGSYINPSRLNIDKVGFEYCANANYIDSDLAFAGSNESPFSKTVQLEDNKTYYYRAFVQMADTTMGILYGETVIFHIGEDNGPTVSTDDATDVDATTAKVFGTISSNYPGEVPEKGFYYGINPDLSNSTRLECGGGKGIYYTRLSNLTPNTTYYYKAYGKYNNGVNSGTNFGEVKSFTTAAAK